MEEINNRIMFFINKYNLNRFLIVLIIILISFSVVHSQPNNYESELIRQEYNLDREIQFFKLEFNLNDDGSVDALLEIRFINPIEIEKDEYVIIEDKLQINDEEQIEEDSFIITDIYRQDLVYTLTDDFDPTDCVGKYFFNPLNNDLQYCVISMGKYAGTQIRYKYKPLCNECYEYYKLKGMVHREINFSYPHSLKPYKASFKASVSENLILNSTPICPDEWKIVRYPNSFECVNKALDHSNKSLIAELNIPLIGILKSSYTEALPETPEPDNKSKYGYFILLIGGIIISVFSWKKWASRDIYQPIPEWKIFVSSPIKGYEKLRLIAHSVIGKDLKQDPIMQERFSASGKTPLNLCLEKVEESDIFVQILAEKSGSGHEGKLICQWEFEKARQTKKQCVVLIKKVKKREPKMADWVKQIKDFKEGVFILSFNDYLFGRFSNFKPKLKPAIVNAMKEPRVLKEIKVKEPIEIQTNKILPPTIEVTQFLPNRKRRNFPDVGFIIRNINNSPLRAKVLVKILLGEKDLGALSGHYSGMKPWNLNPYIQFNGHFKIPKEAVDSSEKLEVEITVTYFDENDVEKKLLPTKFVYMRDKDNWYSEPS